MNKSIVQSFSYDISKAAVLAQAEDKAKEQGKPFSKYIVDLIEQDLKEKKGEALERLPILSMAAHTRQTTITEYDIKLLQDPKERMKNLNNLTKEQQTKVAQDVLFLQQQIRSVRK